MKKFSRWSCLFICSLIYLSLQAQTAATKDALLFPLNADGSQYIQVQVLNQAWLRFNESNPGTLVEGVEKRNTFDIGLRRTRLQLLGQLSDKVFLYFQFGQNNFNAQYNTGNNRKQAAFFHDALGEYKVTRGNQLKLGAGLTIANGLSRFSQPSVGTIMTTDVPVFAQVTVDQTDIFSRKLSVYARGQVGHFDYRFVVSDPFPITSSGAALPPINSYAQFSQMRHSLQAQGYLIYQFFDHENHTTPYMTGTYLGKKKIFNIAAGMMLQPNAMWRRGAGGDTIYEKMQHFAVESFLDMPLNAAKKTALSAYAGFFRTDYGANYLRYNGIMNPANGTSLTALNSITGQGPSFGNAYPMFGTGYVWYLQAGYLMPAGKHTNTRWMPYASFTGADYDRLNGAACNTYNAGLNCLLNGHKSKLSLDWQNRPVFAENAGKVTRTERRNSIVLQYQLFF